MTFFLGFITGAAAMALTLGLYDVLTRDQIEDCDDDCEHCEWVTCPKMEVDE